VPVVPFLLPGARVRARVYSHACFVSIMVVFAHLNNSRAPLPPLSPSPFHSPFRPPVMTPCHDTSNLPLFPPFIIITSQICTPPIPFVSLISNVQQA
jgi:hypothetical protein